MDSRYSIAREWCGHSTRRYVVRFCGAWVGCRRSKRGAYAMAGRHDIARAR